MFEKVSYRTSVFPGMNQEIVRKPTAVSPPTGPHHNARYEALRHLSHVRRARSFLASRHERAHVAAGIGSKLNAKKIVSVPTCAHRFLNISQPFSWSLWSSSTVHVHISLSQHFLRKCSVETGNYDSKTSSAMAATQRNCCIFDGMMRLPSWK